MTRKRLLIFHKISNSPTLSVLIHKLRKPIIPKLLLLKKFRKGKEFKHLKLYNYQFFSASSSSTPLIHYHRNQFNSRRNSGLCAFFYLYCCLGSLKTEERGSSGCGECKLEALPPPATEIEDANEAEDLFDSGDDADEYGSVDEKAERFIERFYQEMRMQRQESI
ncbi:uncharacterized protein LOC130718404 [Lotus japonicus]|uniref:uncharacterized protein LOC130718404 n=1 Tax=Lotus japonicus TaxID=34305 RepID=UPI00258E1DB7|nr:uncharacterized protein LOC130718404 [Lotus japonicus]